ncbi:MAG: ABC transporter permease [Polyangia bacterium]
MKQAVSNARSRRLYDTAMVGLGGILLLFLVLPFVALVFDGGPEAIWRGLGCSLTWPALRLSLATTLVSVALVVVGGTPLAWWLARSRWRSARWLEILLQLPVVIPPAVGGIALLLAFGRRGLFGGPLERLGWTPAFSAAAVVMAQVFVSAPFYLQAAVQAFGRLNPSLLAVARSLGASPPRLLFRVALPLARPWLIGGAAMSWARALGEFGATLMFAGNMTGKTQTLPLAIYTALELDIHTAQALSLLLVSFAFALLLFLRRFNRDPEVARRLATQ